MATKNAIATKAKSKGKTKESSVVAKTLSKTSPKKEKVAKIAKAATPPQPVVPMVTPQIMSGKPKEPKKKAAAPPVVSAADKVDPEWTTYMNQNKAAKPVIYSMSDDYQPKTVISHKVLGLGYVLKSQNNRIEVSFKEGKKTLITNYKK
jgi:hypothetical protein